MDEIWNQSLGSSSKTALNRFLPDRGAMNHAQIVETYFMKPPKTDYQQALMQAVAPYYSSKTLLNQFAKPFQTLREPEPVWEIPNKPCFSYRAETGDSSIDFYNHPLDWGHRIYFAIDSDIWSLDPLKKWIYYMEEE